MPTENPLLMGVLLIVAAALGWLGARLTARAIRPRQPSVPRDFFRGIKDLLEERSEEALESLVRAAQLDTDAVEAQLALAGVYRRRGEVDRAIKVHQSILARTELRPAQRNDALLGLAEDYMGAGLFDRAEGLYRQLDASPAHRVAALGQLVHIYEQQKDWGHAISARAKYGDAIGEPQGRIVSHYYCELAALARAENDPRSARDLLSKAQRADASGVRVALERADLARASGKADRAIALYRKAIAGDAGLAIDVLPSLVACFPHGADDPGLRKAVGGLLGRDPQLQRILGFAAVALGLESAPVFRESVHEYVTGSATLSRVLRGFGLGDSELELPDTVSRVGGALRALASEKPMYRCRECGYRGTRLYWQCPGCRAWDSTRACSRLDVAYVSDGTYAELP